MPPRASEDIEPRLVNGAETPTPKKDRKDSRNMAAGICRQVVTIICPMQLGSKWRLITLELDAPRAFAAVTYSCYFSINTCPRMIRAIPTQYRSPKAIKIAIKLGPKTESALAN